MSTVYNVFGFTGTIWETPDIDKLSASQLLSEYRNIIFTLESNGEYYLGLKENINTRLPNIVARSVLETTPLLNKLWEPAELKKSEWRIVSSGIEKNGTVYFPNNEKVIINGGQFIATESNGRERYIRALTDNMATYKDPVIGSTDVFGDLCHITNITIDTVTANYDNSLLLIGGILFETRQFFDYLGSSAKVIGDVGGWLPTLYKRLSATISPYQCGLSWPIDIKDLSNIEVFNKIIELPSSVLVVFDVPSEVTYETRPISRLFPNLISGIVTYDGRPSCNRVTKLLHSNRCPEKNDLYPTYVDLDNAGGNMVIIDHTVQNIAPLEHSINYISYKVKR